MEVSIHSNIGVQIILIDGQNEKVWETNIKVLVLIFQNYGRDEELPIMKLYTVQVVKEGVLLHHVPVSQGGVLFVWIPSKTDIRVGEERGIQAHVVPNEATKVNVSFMKENEVYLAVVFKGVKNNMEVPTLLTVLIVRVNIAIVFLSQGVGSQV